MCSAGMQGCQPQLPRMWNGRAARRPAVSMLRVRSRYSAEDPLKLRVRHGVTQLLVLRRARGVAEGRCLGGERYQPAHVGQPQDRVHEGVPAGTVR